MRDENGDSDRAAWAVVAVTALIVIFVLTVMLMRPRIDPRMQTVPTAAPQSPQPGTPAP